MPDVRRSFEWACRLDVATRKPGNVSLASPGHRMEAAQFLASAEAASGPLSAPGARVGTRIEQSIRATRSVVQCNTNLGIVLLCAPLAAAAEGWQAGTGEGGLRAALAGVLDALDVDDARAAYRAIALASPGGLGRAQEQDVADEPSVDLRFAMGLAASRDRIARQYVAGFADVFEIGLPAFREHAGPDARGAMLRAFLELLAAFPDSHIVRGRGDAPAHSVMAEAAAWRARARLDDVTADPEFAAWDESLKARGLNPGTTADLCVAAALVAALVEPRLVDAPDA